MPADPLYPGEVDAEPRPDGQFRADLVRYLDALPVSELGSLLSELPRTRPGTLMIELNQRLPDSGKLLPPPGTPGPHEGRRRSLRAWAADRRAARNQPTAGPPDVIDRGPLAHGCDPAAGGGPHHPGAAARLGARARRGGRSQPSRPGTARVGLRRSWVGAHPTCSGRTSRARSNGTTTVTGWRVTSATTAEHPSLSSRPRRPRRGLLLSKMNDQPIYESVGAVRRDRCQAWTSASRHDPQRIRHHSWLPW
jgi:hypothetical protein